MQLVRATHHEGRVHGKGDGLPPAKAQGHDDVHQLPFEQGSAAALCKCCGMGMELGQGIMAVVYSMGSTRQQFGYSCQAVHRTLPQRLYRPLPELLLDFRRRSATHVFLLFPLRHVVDDCNRNQAELLPSNKTNKTTTLPPRWWLPPARQSRPSSAPRSSAAPAHQASWPTTWRPCRPTTSTGAPPSSTW